MKEQIAASIQFNKAMIRKQQLDRSKQHFPTLGLRANRIRNWPNPNSTDTFVTLADIKIY